jgi:hypothetical protein
LPAALGGFPAIAVRPAFEPAVRHGAQPEGRALVDLPRSPGPHRVVSADGERLLAMALVDGKLQFARVRLLRVFPEPLPTQEG